MHDGNYAQEAGTRKPGLPEPADAEGRPAVVPRRAPATTAARLPSAIVSARLMPRPERPSFGVDLGEHGRSAVKIVDWA